VIIKNEVHVILTQAYALGSLHILEQVSEFSFLNVYILNRCPRNMNLITYKLTALYVIVETRSTIIFC
jgi:hypothetical protein